MTEPSAPEMTAPAGIPYETHSPFGKKHPDVQINILGTLCTDPVCDTGEDGFPRTRFCVRVIRPDDAGNSISDRYICRTRGIRAAEAAGALKKDARVFVRGELRPKLARRDNGRPFLYLDLIADHVFLMPRAGTAGPGV